MLRSLFQLDPDVIFLNHGSFGATPRPVFTAYQEWQRRLETQPVKFLGREFLDHMKVARCALGDFLNAPADDLVFVPNATYGVNVVARSLALGPGDEVLSTDHEYGACDRTWQFLSRKRGFRYIRQSVSLPLQSAEGMVAQIWQGVTPRTKVIFLSHITSSTAVQFPVEQVCQKARAAGILTLVDGAHAPGQIPLDLTAVNADFYSGNCHKWLDEGYKHPQVLTTILVRLFAMNKIQRISFCPHCSNETQQTLIHHQKKTGGERRPDELQELKFVAGCSTCNGILIYSTAVNAESDLPLSSSFAQARLIWPEYGLSYPIPDEVKRIYHEALRIKNVAPNAFAVQIRRALEAVCVDQKAPSGSLFKKLKWLADEQKIPEAMVNMADVIRALGNIGAHPDTISVHPLLIPILDKFFQTVAAYLYDDPATKLIELDYRLSQYREIVGTNIELTNKVIKWFKDNPDKYKEALKSVAGYDFSPDEVDIEKLGIWTRNEMRGLYFSVEDVDWMKVFVEIFL